MRKTRIIMLYVFILILTLQIVKSDYTNATAWWSFDDTTFADIVNAKYYLQREDTKPTISPLGTFGNSANFTGLTVTDGLKNSTIPNELSFSIGCMINTTTSWGIRNILGRTKDGEGTGYQIYQNN